MDLPLTEAMQGAISGAHEWHVGLSEEREALTELLGSSSVAQDILANIGPYWKTAHVVIELVSLVPEDRFDSSLEEIRLTVGQATKTAAEVGEAEFLQPALDLLDSMLIEAQDGPTSELLDYLVETVGPAARDPWSLSDAEAQAIATGLEATKCAHDTARAARKSMQRAMRAHQLVLAARVGSDRARARQSGTCEDFYRSGAYGFRRSMLIILADVGDELKALPGRFTTVNLALLDTSPKKWRNELRMLRGVPPIESTKSVGHSRRSLKSALERAEEHARQFPEELLPGLLEWALNLAAELGVENVPHGEQSFVSGIHTTDGPSN